MCLHIAAAFSCIGLTAKPSAAGGERTLRITVGKPVLLSPVTYQNRSCLAVSRVGVTMAIFPRADGLMAYGLSEDGGRTWSPQRDTQPLGGGNSNCMLRGGGVIHLDGNPGSPIENGQQGWFNVAYYRLSDDLKRWPEKSTARVYMPDAIRRKRENQSYIWYWPIFSGKIIQLPDGDLLAPMYGLFKGDAPDKSRVVLCKSTDQGRTWRYHATVAYDPEDPNPELPGVYVGYCEPSVALLPNGRLLCIMRTQGSHLGPEFKPMYVSWSNDLGKTWTKPTPTNPHLKNIWPTLQVLGNGIVAVVYGRPGVHVAFSVDDGHTWPEKVTFSNLWERTKPKLTGMADMVRVGPNKLLVISGVEGGTKVFPITAERVKATSRARNRLPADAKEEGRGNGESTADS